MSLDKPTWELKEDDKKKEKSEIKLPVELSKDIKKVSTLSAEEKLIQKNNFGILDSFFKEWETAPAIQKFLADWVIYDDIKNYTKDINELWTWITREIKEIELKYTFMRLLDFFKNNTKITSDYICSEWLKSSISFNALYKIIKNKYEWKYELDMNNHKVPYFWYLHNGILMISDNTRVIKENNQSSNWISQSSFRSLEAFWPMGWERWSEPKQSNWSLIKWDFDQIFKNQMVNDKWEWSSPRFEIITLKWKIFSISPIYISDDFEKLNTLIKDKSISRLSHFDNIVWNAIKITWSVANLALSVWTLKWNIWSILISSPQKPQVKSGGLLD